MAAYESALIDLSKFYDGKIEQLILLLFDILLTIDDINALEKILFDLDVMINDVKSHYRECGTFESGCGESSCDSFRGF